MRYFVTFFFIIFYAILTAFQYFSFQSFLSRLNEVASMGGIVKWLYFIFLLLAIPMFIWSIFSIKKRDHIFIWCILLVFYMVGSSLLFYNAYPLRDMVLSFVMPTFSILCFIMTYQLLEYNLPKNALFFTIGVALFIMLVMNLMYITRPELLKYSIYAVIPMFCFVLLSKSNFIKFSLFLVIIIITILSGKRTGFIGIIGAFVIYYTLYMCIIRNRDVIWTFVLLPFFFILAFFAYRRFGDDISYITTERYHQFFETLGGGRLDIWKRTIGEIYNSSIFEKIFGKGYLYYEYISTGFFARPHNDLLDFLGTYGILGTIFYLGFIFCIVRTMFKLIMARHQFAPAFTATTFMFVAFSVGSILFFATTFAPIFVFYGYVYHQLYLEKRSLSMPVMKY